METRSRSATGTLINGQGACGIPRARFVGNQLALVLVLVALVVLYSCAATLVPLKQHQVGYKPQYGDTAEAEAGAEVYVEFDYQATAGATLTNGFSWAEVHWLPLYSESVVLPPSFGLVAQTAGTETRYCTPDAQFRSGALGPVNIVCFRDSDDDGTFDEMIVMGKLLESRYELRSTSGWLSSISTAPPPYKKGILKRIEGFKKELVYWGMDGGRLNFTYREYVNTVAEPTVVEDSTYAWAPQTMIDICGARLQLLDADPKRIRFRMVKGFR